MKRARILIADDHAMLLDAFSKLLGTEFDVVGTAGDGRALLEAALRLKPDLIVTDIGMPRLNGLDACEILKKSLPRAKLIFLTVSEDPDVAEEAMRRGANGFLLKKSAASELFDAIRAVLDGKTYLTRLVTREPAANFVSRAKRRGAQPVLSLRQREVLQLLAEGRLMKEAADALNVTSRTIAFHKYSIMQHLGLKTSAELVQYAMEHGLLSERKSTPPAAP
jgi:DNA-binding NarL/FixJ family response regulator